MQKILGAVFLVLGFVLVVVYEVAQFKFGPRPDQDTQFLLHALVAFAASIAFYVSAAVAPLKKNKGEVKE